MSGATETRPEGFRADSWKRMEGVFERQAAHVQTTESGARELVLQSPNPARPDYFYWVTIRDYSGVSDPGSAMESECGVGWKPHNGLITIEVMCPNARTARGLQVGHHGPSTIHPGESLDLDLSNREQLNIVERGTPIALPPDQPKR